MRPKNKQSVRAWIGGLNEVKKVGEVPQTLRHLFAANFNKSVVHPMPGKRAPGCQRLRAFILVVWERKVLSATVKIEAIAQ
ncbi:unannotated protein [freshwater metagenome]|uniref:Unannotated protein n=1 Tax=freshwater metagenome TaxID=449393 RepID=A0A6J6JD48_9ZZZZ